MATRSRSRAIWTLATALVALLAAKTWWGDVYHVDSGSMEPTIVGGESVFVRYDRSPPTRFDLVVLQRPGDEAPLVKRVVALGGERVEVRFGDLVIDGSRLPADAPRPAPIALWDQRWQELEGSFRTGSTQGDPWSRDGDAWVVDARGVAENADAGIAFWTGELDDGWLAPDRQRVPGSNEVADAILSCEVECRDPQGRVRLSLSEQGDLFEAQVAFDAGRARARIVRRNREPEQELAATDLDWPPGARRALRFANVDNALTLAVDGTPALVATYLENQFHPSDPAKLGKSFGDPRAARTPSSSRSSSTPASASCSATTPRRAATAASGGRSRSATSSGARRRCSGRSRAGARSARSRCGPPCRRAPRRGRGPRRSFPGSPPGSKKALPPGRGVPAARASTPRGGSARERTTLRARPI